MTYTTLEQVKEAANKLNEAQAERIATLDTVEDISKFIMAGNSDFKLISAKTGKQLHYQVKHAALGSNNVTTMFWVYSENEVGNFHYLGSLKRTAVGDRYDCKNWEFTATKGTWKHWNKDDLELVSFNWYFNSWLQGKSKSEVIFQHTGHCGVCGRTLTDPESVKRGIGPVCWDRMN